MSRRYPDGPQMSNPDLQDYFDTVPPAHRLSSINTFGSSSNANDIPMTSPSPRLDNYGSQPAAMDSSTRMTTYPAYTDSPGDDESAPIAQNTDWLDKNAAMSKGNSNKSKWIIASVVAGVLILISVGVALGVTLSKKNPGSSSSSSSGGKGSSNNPSVFDKDSNLHKSFYGIAYTPVDSQYPDCGNSLDDIIKDIQLMSQLTTRIRLYGADCNQSALVLEAIEQTKIDMKVYLGNFPSSTDAGEAYVRQRDVIKDALQTYGTDHVAGITVGNEFILNYVTDNGDGQDANSAAGNAGARALIVNITDTREMLKDLKLDIPVGNADAGSYFNDLIMPEIDYGMANVHPWFATVTAEDAATWTWEFFQVNDVELAESFDNKPQMSIAETGWPTKSSDTDSASNGVAMASVEGLNTFLDTFICQANANGTEYFFFEFYDEKWKDDRFGGVEGWWGLFNANRTLKEGVVIPDCEI